MAKLLSIADLCVRWTYTKAGVHKLVKTEQFPKPFAIVSRGKVKIYREEDIELYEKNKPWLFNQEMKKRRQYLFLVNSQKGQFEI